MNNDNITLLNRAARLAEEGRKSEALELIRQAINNDRNDDEAWWALAQLAESDGERRRALDRVLKLRPDHVHALMMHDQLEAGTLPDYPQEMTPRKSKPKHDIFGKPLDRGKDYLVPAIITLVAYWAGGIIGFVLNIYFLHDARRWQQENGYKPANVGCLWWTLVVNGALCICGIALVIIIISVATTSFEWILD